MSKSGSEISNDNSTLGNKTARASLLSVSSRLTAKLIGFAATLVLARILDPEDFGLVAIALMALGLFDVLRNMGTGEALVYQQRYRDIESSSAFWISLTTGVVLFALLLFIAPILATYFKNEQVTNLIRFISSIFIIEALAAIPAARAKRDLEFGTIAYAELTRAVCKGFISIVLALNGFGVWSILYGQFFGAVIGMLVYWFRSNWRPSFAFEWQASRELLSYGLVLIGVGIVAFLSTRFDQFIIARRLDVLQLGYFVMAYTISSTLITDLAYNAGQATCSTFARVQKEASVLKKYYLETLYWHSLFGFGFSIGLAIAAPLVVGVLFADKWEPMIPVLQVLCVHALFVTLSTAPADLMSATGLSLIHI